MNTWLNENKEQINYYISSKDIILMSRKTHLMIMTDLFNAYFQEKKNLNILDLGCGDGALTKLLYDLYPENTYYLLDGSKTMLDKAKKNINSKKAVFINETFENFITDSEKENFYSFIYSSMAIHHLEHHKKKELYSKIYTSLAHNGLFINIDVVLPVSGKTEEIQFKLWIDYINSLLEKEKKQEEIGTHDNLPNIYKNKSENKPSSLLSQLRMLEDIGFKDVECYHKNGVFALFAGIK